MPMTNHTNNFLHSPAWYVPVIFFICFSSQSVFAWQTTAVADNQVAQVESVESANTPVPDQAATPDVVNSPSTTTPYYSANNSTNKVGSGSHLLSVTLALLLIVALIVAVSWFIRRFGQGVFANTSPMKIIATMPLGTRERIMLVEIGGQQLLLGVTASQINTLHVFAEPVEIGTQAAPVSDFSRKLMTILQQKNTPSNSSSNNNSPDQS